MRRMGRVVENHDCSVCRRKKNCRVSPNWGSVLKFFWGNFLPSWRISISAFAMGRRNGGKLLFPRTKPSYPVRPKKVPPPLPAFSVVGRNSPEVSPPFPCFGCSRFLWGTISTLISPPPEISQSYRRRRRRRRKKKLHAPTKHRKEEEVTRCDKTEKYLLLPLSCFSG